MFYTHGDCSVSGRAILMRCYLTSAGEIGRVAAGFIR